MKLTPLLFILIIFPTILCGQVSNDLHIKMNDEDDSSSLQSHFLNAQWQVHSRTFFMSTINEGSLKDDYTLGTGAGIGVLTEPFHGFQIGLNGYFIFELFSSDISKPDPTTQNYNRYEIGLYDITHPESFNHLDRLEELYLKYNYSKSSIMVGRFNINTPFINPQDGRMRPTLEEGAWLSIRESSKIGFNGGWILAVTPRSTMDWYSAGESIGIYPSGVNVNGAKSNYTGNIHSTGIGIVNIYFQPTKKIKINFWNSYINNVMNTTLVEITTDYKKAKNKSGFYNGFLFSHQDALNNGGNADPSKTYLQKGAQSNALSFQLGYNTKKFNTSLNYTHITGDGRYLMPREWGREPFYTFLPRERNEGLGNVNAFMIKTSYISKNNKLKTSIAYGYYHLPDVKNYRLNKYGMPSYHQINYEYSYIFSKFLKGFELKSLIAWKINAGSTYENPKYVYNKVNMINFNLILDFKL